MTKEELLEHLSDIRAEISKLEESFAFYSSYGEFQELLQLKWEIIGLLKNASLFQDNPYQKVQALACRPKLSQLDFSLFDLVQS
jgi:hypothetical protein